MGRNVSMACDCCGDDLKTERDNTFSRLYLEDERVPAKDIFKNQPLPAILDAGKYFCNLECLSAWIDEAKEKKQ